MSRLKQIRTINSLIQSIETITKSQCSLSDDDVKVFDEALMILQDLKRKKGRTNEQILVEIVKVVQTITKYFL
jgi:hypothetical protein